MRPSKLGAQQIEQKLAAAGTQPGPASVQVQVLCWGFMLRNDDYGLSLQRPLQRRDRLPPPPPPPAAAAAALLPLAAVVLLIIVPVRGPPVVPA